MATSGGDSARAGRLSTLPRCLVILDVMKDESEKEGSHLLGHELIPEYLDGFHLLYGVLFRFAQVAVLSAT